MIEIRIPGTNGSGRRLNDLYWRSDRTIEDITSELGITRSALYAGLEPLPTGRRCSECRGPLTYHTRTNRASHTATCESCGATTRLEGDEVEPIAGPPRRRQLPIPPRRVLMIGGAAVIGAAVGTVVACAVRNR